MVDHAPLGVPPPAAAPPPQKWRVTPAQKERLLAAFAEEAYPSPAQKAALASQLGVTGTQISKWFQHRRESLTRLGQFKAQYNRSRRTEHELQVLQKAFDENSYPSAERLAQLESELENVTSKQIKLWFKHRRKQSRLKSAAASMAANTNSPLKGSSSGSPVGGTADALSSHNAAMRSPHASMHGAGASAAGVAAVYPPFSALELMALRGALCMSKSAPSQQGLQALSTFLGRPVEHLRLFFDTELNGGYFWNYLAAMETPSFVAPTQFAATQGVYAGMSPIAGVPTMTGMAGVNMPAMSPMPQVATAATGLGAMSAVTPPTAPATPSLVGSGPNKVAAAVAASPSVGAISPFKWASSLQLLQAPNTKGNESPRPQSDTYTTPTLLGAANVASPLLKLPDMGNSSAPSYQQVWYVPTPSAAQTPLFGTTARVSTPGSADSAKK